MLGPDGQSNGCVSLQDYPKFLEAFLRGDIDRLIVLPSSGAASARAAGDRFSASSRHRDLNISATNMPSACSIANIDPNDAMILPHDANLPRMTFSERISSI